MNATKLTYKQCLCILGVGLVVFQLKPEKPSVKILSEVYVIFYPK